MQCACTYICIIVSAIRIIYKKELQKYYSSIKIVIK